MKMIDSTDYRVFTYGRTLGRNTQPSGVTRKKKIFISIFIIFFNFFVILLNIIEEYVEIPHYQDLCVCVHLKLWILISPCNGRAYNKPQTKQLIRIM